MAIDLLGARLGVLHTAPATDASLLGMRLGVLHDVPLATRVVAGRRSIHPLFELRMDGQDPPPESQTYGQVVKTRTRLRNELLQGTADNQVEVLLKSDSDDDGQLAASGVLQVDMVLGLDPFGNAIVADDLVMLFVRHKASSTASSISLRAASTNGLTNLLGTAAGLTLRPGDFIVVGTFTAGNLVVANANRILEVVNDDGANAADYVVEVWGR